MKTPHALIIGVCLIIGFTSLGLLLRSKTETSNPGGNSLPDGTRTAGQTDGRHLVQAAMLEGDYPRSIEVGEEKLLYWPEVDYQNDWISTKYRFYRLVDGKLVQVAVQDSGN